MLLTEPGSEEVELTDNPATLPERASATLVVRELIISSALTVVAEYPRVFSERVIPIAVTTTSSKFWVSDCRSTLITGFTATSCMFMPTYEICKILPSGGTSKEKRPSISVTVPIVVPLTRTDAPIIGRPSSAAVTVPVTFTF